MICFRNQCSLILKLHMDRSKICVLRFLSRLQVVVNLGGGRAEGHTNRVSCLALAADGDALCTGSWDTTLKVCELYITNGFSDFDCM